METEKARGNPEVGEFGEVVDADGALDLVQGDVQRRQLRLQASMRGPVGLWMSQSTLASSPWMEESPFSLR